MSLHTDFLSRHLGLMGDDASAMLKQVGYDSLAGLVDDAVPPAIRSKEALALPEAASEADALDRLRATMSRNLVLKSCIGQGYHGTYVPGVIQRNILENPGWYTQYTPDVL